MRILQRLIIAEAIVQGLKIAAIARQLSVSRSWASREANAPETRLRVVELLAQRAPAISQLIEDGFANAGRSDEGNENGPISGWQHGGGA
jgi:hypothetical protein